MSVHMPDADQAVLDAIRVSASEGRWVDVEATSTVEATGR